MNKDINIKKSELAQLISRKAMVQDPVIAEALEAKIKTLEADIGTLAAPLLSTADMVEAKIKAALANTSCDEIIRAFEFSDSLVALRICNSAINNMLNSVFFADLIYRDQSAKMGAYVQANRGAGWGSEETDTSAYKDDENTEQKLLRLQEEVEQCMRELPRWIKAALDLRAHCKAENRKFAKNGDEIPTAHEVYARVNNRSKANQEAWEAQRKATKAAAPSIMNFLS